MGERGIRWRRSSSEDSSFRLGVAGDQPVDDRPSGRARYCEADTDVRIDGAAFYLRVDPDYAAEAVEQRSTRVAVVDRGIGLDRVRDRHSVRRVDVAPQGANDPGGHRPL